MKIITAIFLVLHILIVHESNKVNAVSTITVANTASSIFTPCAQRKLNGGYLYSIIQTKIDNAMAEACNTVLRSVSYLVHMKKGFTKRVCKKTKPTSPSKLKLQSGCFATYRGCREKCRWVETCMEECRQRYYKCIDSNWDTGFLEEDRRQKLRI
ncbi:uncharacterized protein LOC142980252 [Anticarsia gemmatalis]|uniref:uncharacterized protein LOC142980252 n=1 Tax=Anticarsia gemmatalis TaxID=129554 RepID=UPI003F7707F9